MAENGFQILAITPDKPEKLAEGRSQNEWRFKLLADSKMQAARAFGIAFKLDEATKKTYRGYGIDLAERTGDAAWELPVPAVFIVGTDGVIDFQYVNPDYKERLSAEVVLAAAKALGK